MPQDHPGNAATALGAHSKDAMGGAANAYGDTADMAQDIGARIAETVRERPITTVLAALTVGWLIGRIGRYV